MEARLGRWYRHRRPGGDDVEAVSWSGQDSEDRLIMEQYQEERRSIWRGQRRKMCVHGPRPLVLVSNGSSRLCQSKKSPRSSASLGTSIGPPSGASMRQFRAARCSDAKSILGRGRRWNPPIFSDIHGDPVRWDCYLAVLQVVSLASPRDCHPSPMAARPYGWRYRN